MRYVKRSTPFHRLPLAAPLLGALVLLPAAPVRAGDDDDNGRIAAREVMETIHDQAKDRAKFFFGDDESPDPVLDRGKRGRVRFGEIDDQGRKRRLAAEEILDGIEDRLNQGKWIPFRHRKASGPQVLAGLDELAPDPPAIDDSWRSRFRFSVVRGIEYRQDVPLAGNRLQMRFYGPVVPNGPGLGFQLKGRVLDRRMRLNAYGTTDEAGLTLDIEF
jgi:hypothetical protein